MKDNKEGENADDGLGDYDESSAADIAKLLGFGGFGTTKVSPSLNICQKKKSSQLPSLSSCHYDDYDTEMEMIMTIMMMTIMMMTMMIMIMKWK